MKRNKWLIGLGAVLAVYLLYPNEEPKVVEPVKVEKKVNKHKIDFQKINEILNQNKPKKEIVLEEVVEESNLPSCLQCDDWKPKVTKLWYDTGELKGIMTTNCGVRHGEQFRYFKNGQIEISGDYSCGVMGQEKWYYPNGQIKIEINRKNGIQHGLRRDWYENGQLNYETNYVNGKQEGLQRTWHDNGILIHEKNYKNGIIDGFERGGHYNGQIWFERNFIKDNKEGSELQWYDSRGMIMDK
ncbi:MAG: toxin-antitoxin system YwqK family antitoxin [Nanoarchaeota archaeon]|nr:toxin-antitoxin system YwqK family antitoxin [Nanoarchaeota archaeon]